MTGETTSTKRVSLLQALLSDRPIAYHPMLAKIFGGVQAGIFLSQLCYWSARSHDPDGWVYKTREQWQDETGLTRAEQDTARRHLRTCGVLHEKKRRGLDRTVHYRVDYDVIRDTANANAGFSKWNDDIQPVQQLDSVNVKEVLTEITSESTSEIGVVKKTTSSIDEEFVSRMVSEFTGTFTEQRVRDEIETALNHKASSRWLNKQKGIKNWLKKSAAWQAEKVPAAAGMNANTNTWRNL